MTRAPSPDTVCVHGAHAAAGDAAADSALVPPIVYSATFAARNAQAFAEMASQPRHARYYTRYGNPLHEQVARQLVALEGGNDTHDALVTASGMGAVSLVLLGLLKAGDHVVAQTNHYMASAKHFAELLPRFGVRCTLVDQTDLAAWQRAIQPGTQAGDDRDAGQSDLRADRSGRGGDAGARGRARSASATTPSPAR